MTQTSVRWGWSLVIGAIGGAWLTVFGKWSTAMTILCVCMALDYLSGVTVAGIFHTSPKSDSGRLNSNAGLKGFVRKIATLCLVFIAQFLDVMLGTQYIRDALVVALIVNEMLSIVENFALMGVKIPKVLLNGIDVLHNQSGEADEKPPDQGEEDLPELLDDKE